jgi:hypothetical protein
MKYEGTESRRCFMLRARSRPSIFPFRARTINNTPSTSIIECTVRGRAGHLRRWRPAKLNTALDPLRVIEARHITRITLEYGPDIHHYRAGECAVPLVRVAR